jgi:acetyl esterase/lipase
VTHAGVEAIRAFLAEANLLSGSLDEQRAAMDAAAAGAPPPAGIEVEEVLLGGRPAEWLVPQGVPRQGAVLYLHGGGYCSGSLDSHRGIAGRIARAAGIPVVSLGYRLAPEDPFPAAVEDAVAAYRQLLDDGLGPASLAVAGDSAGGGLTVAALVALRDGGTPPPAAAVCLSPWVDLTQSAPSYREVGADDPMVAGQELDALAAAYLGGADPRDPSASPLFADLAGLPPLRIEVGSHEVLRDDARRLAERARSAGVEAELVEWPGMIHVFQAFPGELLPEADQSIAGIGSFLSGRLTVGAGS